MFGTLLRRRLIAAGAAGMMVLAFVVAACGGSSSTPTPAPTKPATATTAPTTAATATTAPTATRAATAAPSAVPTATPAPTATATPAPTRVPGDTSPNGAITTNSEIGSWVWLANKPNWNVPPQRGGTFNYGFTTPPAGLDPILNRSFTVMSHATIAYNALVRCAPAALLADASTALCQPFPDLAQSWSQSADGLTWTFKLVTNAKWQNVPTDAYDYSDALKPLYGRAFKAADAVSSINYWLGKLVKSDGSKQGTPSNVALAGVDTVSAPDDTTLVIKTTTPQPRIPFVLSDFQLRVMSPEVFALDGDYTKHVVGTGSFILKTFAADARSSSWVANQAYFRTGGDGKPLPYMDAYTFTVVSDTALAYSSVVTGKLHVHQSIGVNTPSAAIQFAKDCPTCQVAQVYSAQGVFGIGFKTDAIPGTPQDTPFKDPRARLAVSKSIDWNLFIKNRYEGAAILAPAANATPVIFDVLPTVDNYVKQLRDAGIKDDDNPYVFNPTLAQQLWKASGHNTGETLALVNASKTYGGTLAADFQAIAGLVGQNLGITVNIDDKTDSNSFYGSIGYQGGQPHQNFTGMALYFNTLYPDNAQSIFNQFTPGQQANFMEFNDPAVTALAAEINKGVPLAREKEISKQVFVAEHTGNGFRRLVLPTSARFSTYNGAVRNVYQQSRGGEAFHQGGNLIELVWLAK